MAHLHVLTAHRVVSMCAAALFRKFQVLHLETSLLELSISRAVYHSMHL